MNNILELFKKYGYSASYHYADDSGSERDLASKKHSLALKLFDDYPTHQEAMREIAKEFLWSINQDRPRPSKPKLE